MRLFVAVPFAAAQKETMAKIGQRLCEMGATGRFVPPERLHLTLAFLGEQSAIEPARTALEKVDFAPFEMQIDHIGRFFGSGGIDILWLGIQKNPQLMDLQQAVCDALTQQGVWYDPKPFRAHVTLARQFILPEHIRLGSLGVAQMHNDVNAIHLMESRYVRGKLQYESCYRKGCR